MGARFTWYRFLSRLYFFLPILILFFLRKEMSFFEIGLLVSMYSLSGLVLSPQIQALLSGYPIKWTIVVGEMLKGLGLILLLSLGYAMETFWAFLLGQTVAGLGYALANGPDSHILRLTTDETSYKHTEKRAHTLVFVALFLSGCIGAYLASFEITWPFLLSILVAFLSALIATTFPKTRSPCIKASPPLFSLAPLFALWNPLISPSFRRAAMMYGLTRGLLLATFVAFLPVMLLTITQLTLPVFGIVLGTYSLASMGASHASGWVMTSFSPKTVYRVLCFLMMVAFGIIGIGHIFEPLFYGVPGLIGLCLGFIRPATLSQLRECQDGATLLTSADYFSSVCSLLSVPLVMGMMDRVTVSFGLFFLSLLGGLSALGSLIFLSFPWQEGSEHAP